MILGKYNIFIEDGDSYECTSDGGVTFGPTTEQVKQLVIHLWRIRPELIRDIICEECPEHIKCIEDENYRMAYGEKTHP
jgi:hypothetical protein